MQKEKYVAYCKNCKATTTHNFYEFEKGEFISYKCENCDKITKFKIKEKKNIAES